MLPLVFLSGELRALFLPFGILVNLAGLADYAIVETPGGIERLNQQYRRYVSIDFRGPGRMANDSLESALESFPVPAGYQIQKRDFQFFTDEV